MKLRGKEWLNLLSGSLLLIGLIWLLGVDLTLWPALGLWLTAVVFGHMCMTAERYVAFPDLVAFACCLAWVVSPWLATMYTPSMVVFRMALSADEYLRYAVPATTALWLGLHLQSARKLAQNWSVPETGPLPQRVQRSLDVTIVVGLVVETYSESFGPSLAFLAYLISSFRFFGALGWMVTRTPGWRLRVAVVMLHLVAVQSAGGFFYLVVHWAGYFVLVYAFMRRWRWRLAGAIAVGFVTLGLLQEVKPAFRTSLDNFEVTGPIDSLTRLVTLMYQRAMGDETVGTDSSFGDFLVRFNQGWIIARVMTHVPMLEPYAEGDTLIDAAIFSVVPRPLFPFKREGASRDTFTRFTGVKLFVTTRMGLGTIGEFYANFSLVGGVIATFVYGWLMGTLFGWFARNAEHNPLWWAAAAFVLLPGVEPGFNVEDIANHVVKAALVLLVVRKTVPMLSGLLSTEPQAEPVA